jgi:4-hydroxybenzoyl-CoA reductase subunit gamma
MSASLISVMARRAKTLTAVHPRECGQCRERTIWRRGALMQEETVRPVSSKRLLRLRINGREREDAVAENQLLLDYLREIARLTGVKSGCDGGECGACTVLVDGEAVPSCLTLAVRCHGRHVETIEGLVRNGRPDRLQRAFHERLGTQCGYCTPGMIMAAEALLRRNPSPSEQEIRAALSGNLCRCTGYVKIVASVQAAAQEPS